MSSTVKLTLLVITLFTGTAEPKDVGPCNDSMTFLLV
jgi:hypothetical protein